MFGSQWLANAGSGYEIDQSIRFNFADAPSLLRTPDDASNRKTWTWSAWVKRSNLGNPGGPNTAHMLFGVGSGSCLRFPDSDVLRLESPGGQHTFVTTQVFRDTSAWYHIVLAFDSTQATDTNRRKLYINGSQVTSFSSTTFTELGQNDDWDINSTSEHQIGKSNTTDYFGGYMAEIQLVDGTALAPTAFGETNDDGVWVPIAYAGAYGTNGYFIDGRDSGDLGDDESGNGNDYASSGLAAADQMLDSPTINFSTMNPLAIAGGATEFLNGNLDLDQDNFGRTRGTIAFDVQDSDGFYFEVKKTSGNASASYRMAGIVATTSDFGTANVGSINPSVTYYMEGGEVNQNGSLLLGSLATFTLNDVLGVAVRNGKVYFAKNDTYVNSGDPEGESGHCAAITGSAPLYTALVGETNNETGITSTVNFGATAFAHSPPSGYKKINTSNLPTPAVKDGTKYFQSTLYEGNDSTQSINQAGNSTFQPDWVWIKNRDAADAHALFDAVRGATEVLSSNVGGSGSASEATNDDTLTGFESDGFALGDDVIVNTNNESYVAWQWKANGAGSSNEDGSINTTATSANTTAGFSILNFDPTGNAATVGHGLGVVPAMIITKARDQDGTTWPVYHKDVGNTHYLRLSSNTIKQDSVNAWHDTTPTSSVYSVGVDGGDTNNTSTDAQVAYVFANVEGFSLASSFTGNGSADGPFIYTGFTPAFVMGKRATGSGNYFDWWIFDNKRLGYNLTNARLNSNDANPEDTGAGAIDILSNGFKIRTNTSSMNTSGDTMIFLALAEHPFGGDGAAPGTAR